MRASALLVLAGCNQLIGAGEPTLLPDADPAAPSCAGGWRTRIPIVIDNPSGRELVDYQVAVQLPATPDLRFAAGDTAPLLQAAEPDGVWVRIPVIPPGISEIEAFVDNPQAPAWTSESPFEAGIVSNPSFELNNGWTPDPPIGPAALITLADDWASSGDRSLLIDHEVIGTRDYEAYAAISQEMTFPEGTEHVLRFDLDVIAISHGGVLATNDGTFLIWLGGGLSTLYKLTGDVSGVHLAQEPYPIGPGTSTLTIATKIERGDHPGYAKGNIDHLRVRKYVAPAPTVHVGSPRVCEATP